MLVIVFQPNQQINRSFQGLENLAGNGCRDQITLAWLLSRELATIPGTRSLERLEENWASQAITLPAEQLERLAALIDQGIAGERY